MNRALQIIDQAKQAVCKPGMSQSDINARAIGYLASELAQMETIESYQRSRLNRTLEEINGLHDPRYKPKPRQRLFA